MAGIYDVAPPWPSDIRGSRFVRVTPPISIRRALSSTAAGKAVTIEARAPATYLLLVMGAPSDDVRNRRRC